MHCCAVLFFGSWCGSINPSMVCVNCTVAADIQLLVCRHLAALKQRELENARVTAEEMEKQMAPLR